MRTGPDRGPAPALPSRASAARLPNSPAAPRTVVPRRASPEAWAAYLAETAVAVEVPEPAVAPARSRAPLAVGIGAVAAAIVLALVALGLAPRTSAASVPWDRPDPVVHHAARVIAPTPTRQPFPGHVTSTVRQVVSVVAPTIRSRTAMLRLWHRDADGAWWPVGDPAPVEVGTGGLTRTPSDARPQTPIGTWAMDTVLARDAGVTRLPEHVLRPGDGWSSCLTCANYDRLAGSGELWAGRNSWSRIAIHIVTNPGRVRGRSSGIFLHVGAGGPTAGCVGTSLPVALAVARWLDPADHPRIVIAAGD